jgi:transcriptional regulator with XRE-family HTH domain
MFCQIYAIHFNISIIFDTFILMQAIKDKIKKKGVTKSHVAKMIGINNATLSRILKGKQEYVSQDIHDKLHRYLDRLNTTDKTLTLP